MMRKVWIFLFAVVIILSGINFVYGGNMADKDIIILPAPDTKGGIPLETAIANRRSVRGFAAKSLNLEQISQLLWAAQGITSKEGYRSAPSAGALYPLEIYLLKEDGLFHYIPAGHKIKRVSGKDLRGALQSAALFQSPVGKAAIDIVICAVYDRITLKYGERGMRYTNIEVGHVAQNIQLEATALGLGSVPIGAFSDDAVAGVLSLPKEETPLYIIPVGYKK